jgi:hypothetical protein
MKTPPKLDLYQLHKTEYATSKKPALVGLKPVTYLAIDGRGAPGGESFTASIGALYAMAFTIKMTRKFAGLQDYTVCKLEAQWWANGDEQNFARLPKEQWHWKLLIRTPEFIKRQDLAKAVAVLLKRGKSPEVKNVKLETINEGPCVQMLHIGPYEKEDETIALMKAFAEKNRFSFHGRHHEIYLSDPRRVPAERLKTILRQPLQTTSTSLKS